MWSVTIRQLPLGIGILAACSSPTGPGTGPSPDPLLVETRTLGPTTTRNDLFTIRPDGTGRHNIWGEELSGQNYSSLFVTYSPDRTLIAFLQFTTTTINLRDQNGANPTSISAAIGGESVFDLRWYPDNAHLVVSCGKRCQQWLLGLDGSRVPLPFLGSDPEWSRDGRFLAVTKEDSARVDQVFVVRTDGSDPRQLTTGSSPARRPRWSPDGSVLLFSTADAIWIVSAAGGSSRRLVGATGYGAWSPDGTWVAFSNAGHLYVVRSDGADVRQVPLQGEIANYDW